MLVAATPAVLILIAHASNIVLRYFWSAFHLKPLACSPYSVACLPRILSACGAILLLFCVCPNSVISFWIIKAFSLSTFNPCLVCNITAALVLSCPNV